MKKNTIRNLVIIGVSVALVLIIGLTLINNDDGAVGTIEDFFPFTENTIHYFEASEEQFNQTFFTAHIEGNRMQQLISIPNLETTNVLERANGELRLVFFDPEPMGHILHNITGVVPNVDIIILQEPLALGHSWSSGGDGGYSTIVSVDEVVETPYRTFTDGLVVVTELDNGFVTRSYFVKGYGRVKETYVSTTMDDDGNFSPFVNTSALAEVRHGGLEVEMLQFVMDDMAMYLEVDFHNFVMHTNQDFNATLAEVIPHDVEINSIDVDRSLDLVTVDFAYNFIEGYFGAGTESLVLQGLTNTIAMFFNVENFRITINGNNFSTGHMYFGDDEYLTIDFSNLVINQSN